MMAIPHWKDPITHTSWRKGDKYVKSRRLQLSDPLLHHSGEVSGQSSRAFASCTLFSRHAARRTPHAARTPHAEHLICELAM